jgi:hypothetical protein
MDEHDAEELLEELEALWRVQRALDELIALLQLWWDASEEVTVGLAA